MVLTEETDMMDAGVKMQQSTTSTDGSSLVTADVMQEGSLETLNFIFLEKPINLFLFCRGIKGERGEEGQKGPPGTSVDLYFDKNGFKGVRGPVGLPGRKGDQGLHFL